MSLCASVCLSVCLFFYLSDTHAHTHTWLGASDSGSGGRGFDSQPSHVVIAFGKQFTLTVKWVPSYCDMRLQHPWVKIKSGFQMYWSAGALVALLCGDTVTLSNENKFPERD